MRRLANEFLCRNPINCDFTTNQNRMNFVVFTACFIGQCVFNFVGPGATDSVRNPGAADAPLALRIICLRGNATSTEINCDEVYGLGLLVQCQRTSCQNELYKCSSAGRRGSIRRHVTNSHQRQQHTHTVAATLVVRQHNTGYL